MPIENLNSIPNSQINNSVLESLSDLAGFLSFIGNFILWALTDCPCKIIFVETGNQAGKTASIVMNYVLRILGIHPIEKRNLRPDNSIRTLRFAAESLPMETNEKGEVKNSIYPQFKKFFPSSLIKKEITFRKPVMTLTDPQGGPDIFLEFVSYGQEVQSQAGVQRFSIFEDEQPNKSFHEEQIPRLIASDGDIIMGLTPADTICFDQETELLTKRGWVRYNQILMSDLMLTYNINLDYYEWKPIIGFYLNYVNQELHSLVCADFDALVTDGHKLVIENIRKLGHKYLEKIENLNSKHRIKRLSCFNNSENNPLYSDQFIRLVGWAVTDGTFQDGITEIHIYQSQTAYPKNCEEIRQCLKYYPDTFWNERQYKYGNRMICGKMWNGFGISCHFDINAGLAKPIRSVCNHKTINQDFICSLSKRQLEILFETMIKGDGHRYENGMIKFTQTENYKLLEDFQLIATLLGRKTTIREDKSEFKRYGKRRFGVYVWAEGKRYSIDTHYKSLKHEKQNYTGFIWCPSTENGTLVMKRNNCISISGNSWTYEDIYQRAGIVYNSQKIIDYLKEKTGITHQTKEINSEGNPEIAVIRAATDDNPIYIDIVDKINKRDKVNLTVDEYISKSLVGYDDKTTMETRRYGIFNQISGVIFGEFEETIHKISRDKYFPTGMPHEWFHARAIDYHPHTNWACGWCVLSNWNEMFIYNEFNPSPDSMITLEMSREIAYKSKDYRFGMNLVDPTMDIKQPNTGLSPLEDFNRYFHQFLRDGIGTGGYWVTWDTKSQRGKDAIKERLKNSRLVGRPFNNKMSKDGHESFLPTIWVLDCCPITLHMFKYWRWEQWITRESQATKEEKNKEEDKNSHFPRVYEAILKHPGFSIGRFSSFVQRPNPHDGYFNAGTRR